MRDSFPVSCTHPLAKMDVIYFSIGGLVLMIVIFKREFLVWKQTFMPVLLVSLILFCAGIILHFMQFSRDSKSGALLCPLLSLGLYRFCRALFLKWTKREPRDTFLNFDSGLARDNLFNLVYFPLAIGTWLLTTLITYKLAQAGW